MIPRDTMSTAPKGERMRSTKPACSDASNSLRQVSVDITVTAKVKAVTKPEHGQPPLPGVMLTYGGRPDGPWPMSFATAEPKKG